MAMQAGGRAAVSFVAVAAVILAASQTLALGPKISDTSSGVGTGNKHNLSALNQGTAVTYKAVNDSTNNPKGQQICIFCHTPHSANVEDKAPLWNRRFSAQTFDRYSTAASTLQIRKDSLSATTQYGSGAQPNGSTKLCLSCHDGVSKLGEVYNGTPIAMTTDVITGLASFKPDTNKMKSGHHPVSFVYTPAVASAITAAKASTYTVPSLTQVKLDKLNRMQCTTCHDAHQNQSFDDQCYVSPTCVSPNTRKKAPFWVYGGGGTATLDQQAVCMTCHPMDAGIGFSNPWP